MQRKLSLAIVTLGFIISGCSLINSHPTNSTSHASDGIAAADYVKLYDNGFTGKNAMGRDPNLNYAWSRTAAASTCGIEYNKDNVVSYMSTHFGESTWTHELDGIGFHYIQSSEIPNFCTKKRISEIEKLIPNFEKGDFPKKF